MINFVLNKKPREGKLSKKNDKCTLSTSSLISPSFQDDPTIFYKGIFHKQTPHIKK